MADILRGYGAFARILARYVRDRKLLSLEEGLFKMTGLPAATIGLDRSAPEIPPRGRLAPGWAADLVVFDPAEVADKATFESPHLLAEGFSHVMVNGRLVIDEGELTAERAGKVLRMAPR